MTRKMGEPRVMEPSSRQGRAFGRVLQVLGWRYLLILCFLTAAAALAGVVSVGIFTWRLGNLVRLEEKRHTGLELVRREFIFLDEALDRLASGTEERSPALRERAERLENALSSVDLIAQGAPREYVDRLKEKLYGLAGRISPEVAKGVGGLKLPPPHAAARGLSDDWLAIEKAIDIKAVEEMHEAEGYSRSLMLLLSLLWLGVAAAGILLAAFNLRRTEDALDKLSNGHGIVASGDFTHRLAVAGSDDLKPVLEGFNRMAEGLQREQDRFLGIRKSAEMKMREVARCLAGMAEGETVGRIAEGGEPAQKELARSANALAAAHENLRLRLESAEAGLRNWRWRVEDDVNAILVYLRKDYMEEVPPPLVISEASPLADLKEELCRVANGVRETVGLVRESAEKLHQASKEIMEKSGTQEKEFRDEYRVIHETATSVNEVSVAAKQSSQMVEHVFRSSQEAVETAEEGHLMIERIMDGMHSITAQVGDIAQEILNLSDKSQEIGAIARTISDISKQTNLLALNAAIEAAGAGEHGKGFAVVAKEIRELASRSSAATKEIEHLISLIQQATNAAVMATEQGSKKVEAGALMVSNLREAFHRIIERFQEVVESAHEISTASQEQTVGARQVAMAIGEIDKMMKSSLENVREFRDLVGHYDMMTESLRIISARVKARE